MDAAISLRDNFSTVVILLKRAGVRASFDLDGGDGYKNLQTRFFHW